MVPVIRPHVGAKSSETVERVPIPRWKRGLDILCILISSPFSLSLAIVLALLIKMCSRGPVLFRQERIGYGGERFVCLKFRTMKVGADTAVHENYLHHLIRSEIPMTKMDIKGDTRLIPFGSVLRATGLDELPQIINVIRGEMSLVGPRPCLPYEYADYSHWQKRRFETLPGLTGLWQVSGKNRTTFTEMIYLDIWYAEHKSLWLDLKIMARTVPAVVSQVVEGRIGARSSARHLQTAPS